MIQNNNIQFAKEIKNIKEESILEKKLLVKREVKRVYNFDIFAFHKHTDLFENFVKGDKVVCSF